MRLLSKTQLFFHEAPLVRVLIPILSGIFFQLHFEFNNFLYSLILLGFTAIAYFLFQQFSFKKIVQFYWINGFFVQCTLFLLGLIITQFNDETQQKNYYKNLINHSTVATIRLLENPIEKVGSYKALAEVNNIGNEKSLGKTIVYFDKKSYNSQFEYGDELLIPNHFTEIKNSGNPGCFNYKFSCLTQGITYQIFLHETECEKFGNRSNPFWKKLWQVRDSTLSILEKSIVHEREVGVAQALLIGYRDNLDKDLQQAYSDTGIVHILAISGMHLALIFGMLNFFFSFLDKKRKTKILKSIIVLAIIWLFSLLTGSSGSVIRAAVMFSFLQLSTLLKHKTSIYNSLAASALFILVIDPYIAADVGFQLSYIAVIGIVSLQKFIKNWVTVDFFYFKKVWDNLIAISIAAEIVAFPICLFYFHQLPNYFLLANLIAIPLSTIILYAELGMIFLSVLQLNYLAKMAGIINYWLIMLMNKGIEWVDNLPGAVWNGLQFNIFQIVLLYVVIIYFIVWFLYKKSNHLKIALGLVLLFLSWKIFDEIEIIRQKKIIVYAIPHGSAIDFVEGKNYSSFKDSLVQSNHITQNFHLKPARILFGLANEKSISNHSTQSNEFTFNNNKIIYLGKVNSEITLEKNSTNTIVIVAHNAIGNVDSLVENLHPKMLVFDSSNSIYKAKKWTDEASKLKIPIWNTALQGALVLDL